MPRQAKLFRGILITTDIARWCSVNFTSANRPMVSIALIPPTLILLPLGPEGMWLRFSDHDIQSLGYPMMHPLWDCPHRTLVDC